MTGRYPHVKGAISNHTAMASNEETLGELFRDAGYHSIGLGKLHLFSEKEASSFDETCLTGGQSSDAITPDFLPDDYKTWLQENGHWEAAKAAYAIHDTDEYWDAFQANTNPIPSEAFFDNWIGDRAVEAIERQTRDKPFFMFVGLPNPHTPFDCPEPYASMYDPAIMPIPETFGASLDNKPPQHAAFRRGGRRANYENLDEGSLQKAMAYYYGAVTLVDDQVGKIVAAVERHGFDDNTIIAFCSDHGELLGHLGMLTKSIDKYPMLYDVGLHVPLIVKTPAGAPAVFDDLVELLDLCPTLLESAGLSIPPEIQGHSLAQAVSDGGAVYERDYVFAESGGVKMLRSRRWKLVHYPNQTYGELYDLQKDPGEVDNLYALTAHRAQRDDMTRALVDRLISTEATRHGESLRGPAFWRAQRSLPYED